MTHDHVPDHVPDPGAASPATLAPLAPIVPTWSGPPRVRALFTTRAGGASTGAAATLDLGPAHLTALHREGPVAANRQRLRALLPADPVWLHQVHGTRVVTLDVDDAAEARAEPPEADAAVTRATGIVLTVRTADCLPVLLADRAGTVVAVAHAGWRGLAAGVLPATLAAMGSAPHDTVAWLGPAIGPTAFEVGRDVYDAYCTGDPGAASSFVPHGAAKWHADLAGLARRQLATLGLLDIAAHGGCTFSEPDLYFSYRRDRAAGRMALVAWLAPT